MRILQSIHRRVVKRNQEVAKQRQNPSVVEYADDHKSLFAVLRGHTNKNKNSKSKNKNKNNKKMSVSTMIMPCPEPGASGEFDTTTSSGYFEESTLSGAMGSDHEDGTEDEYDDSPPTIVEWKVPLLDKETSEPETMEQEFQRLQVLQSYFALDTNGNADFDRLTQLAALLLDAPIALISLVDLGRQYFLSRVGLDAIRETPRKYSFCAHAILSQHKLFVVPDLSRDERFQDNPFVATGLKARFYAGAALISPEGYKLGTICVVSLQPRPQGLTETQRVVLLELAQLVVSTLVARRQALLKQEYERQLRCTVAPTFYDLQTQLEHAQQALQKVLVQQPRAAAGGLRSTTSITLTAEESAQLTDAARNLGVQAQVCAAATRIILQDTLRHEEETEESSSVQSLAAQQQPSQEQPAEQEAGKGQGRLKDDGDYQEEEEQKKPAVVACESKDDKDSPAVVPVPVVDESKTSRHDDENNKYGILDTSILQYEKIVHPTTDMQQLLDHLDALVSTFTPRHSVSVVTLELYKMVPKRIVAEELLLFRSIWNLWTHCLEASAAAAAAITGSAEDGSNPPLSSSSSYCGLRIRNKKQENEQCHELLIQCMQGGPPVSFETAKSLFNGGEDNSSLLAPVATMVRSMGGQYGMYTAPSWLHTTNNNNQKKNDNQETLDDPQQQQQQQPRSAWMKRMHSNARLRAAVAEAAKNPPQSFAYGATTTMVPTEKNEWEYTTEDISEDAPLHSIFWLQIPYELLPEDTTTTTTTTSAARGDTTRNGNRNNAKHGGGIPPPPLPWSEDGSVDLAAAATAVDRFAKTQIKVYHRQQPQKQQQQQQPQPKQPRDSSAEMMMDPILASTNSCFTMKPIVVGGQHQQQSFQPAQAQAQAQAHAQAQGHVVASDRPEQAPMSPPRPAARTVATNKLASPPPTPSAASRVPSMSSSSISSMSIASSSSPISPRSTGTSTSTSRPSTTTTTTTANRFTSSTTPTTPTPRTAHQPSNNSISSPPGATITLLTPSPKSASVTHMPAAGATTGTTPLRSPAAAGSVMVLSNHRASSSHSMKTSNQMAAPSTPSAPRSSAGSEALEESASVVTTTTTTNTNSPRPRRRFFGVVVGGGKDRRSSNDSKSNSNNNNTENNNKNKGKNNNNKNNTNTNSSNKTSTTTISSTNMPSTTMPTLSRTEI